MFTVNLSKHKDSVKEPRIFLPGLCFFPPRRCGHDRALPCFQVHPLLIVHVILSRRPPSRAFCTPPHPQITVRSQLSYTRSHRGPSEVQALRCASALEGKVSWHTCVAFIAKGSKAGSCGVTATQEKVRGWLQQAEGKQLEKGRRLSKENGTRGGARKGVVTCWAVQRT